MKTETDPNRFDREFFERFYVREETCASSPREFARLSRFVLAYLEYLEIPVAKVLDLGCGLGRWKQALHVHNPSIDYTGVDVSPYLCEKYGWIQSSVSEFNSRRRYDLVICQDVLPYLTPRGIRDSLANIARLSKGAAYLQMLTKEDWEEGICDPARTDHSMRRLDAAWYRKAIARHFINCGGGVFVPKESDVAIWTLERI